MSRRTLLAAAAAAPLAAALAACGSRTSPAASAASGDGGAAAATSSRSAALAASVTYQPAAGTTGASPTAPVSVTAAGATLQGVALTGDDGVVVTGALSADGSTWTAGEPLGYGKTYTWSGTAGGPEGTSVPLAGTVATVAPGSRVSARVNIGDGQAVGVAAPIMVTFDGPVTDKAAAQQAMTVTTTPATEGAWAWLPDGPDSSRAHWRPRAYWAAGTAVSMDAKVYGVDLGGGAWGSADLSTSFTVDRLQVVKADVPSHRMVVVRDGQTVLDVPCSYGEANEARNTTRNGIHVVTEKYEDFLMSNPPYYENVRERWATRISNNGEFIHANPLTTGVQGASNVTNGCINLSTQDAQTYFGMAVYGDPVEVTGSPIELSAADGDIYDWSVDWPTWLSMSAL
ncbi:L,D-transpeptidase LdtMt5 [Rhodococcus aerolatus]